MTHDLRVSTTAQPSVGYHMDPMIRELCLTCTLWNEMVLSEAGSVDQLGPPVCLGHTRPRSSLHSSDCSVQAQPGGLTARCMETHYVTCCVASLGILPFLVTLWEMAPTDLTTEFPPQERSLLLALPVSRLRNDYGREGQG